jgi:hypothetical protein
VHFYNARYGAEMVAPATIFVAILVSHWRFPALRRFWSVTGYGVVAIFIAVQSILVASGGIISVQDGEYGRSCARYHEIDIYLAQHYTGGKILEDVYTSDIDGLDAGVDFKNIINVGSGKLWTAALHNPAAFVDWIIVHPIELKLPYESPDLVALNINRQSSAFIAQFTLVVQEPTGIQLYHRNGLSSLPTRSVPPGLLTEHSLCGNGGS